MTTTPKTDHKPQAVTEAEAALQSSAAEIQKAKAALADAERAYAGAADADADAYLAAVEAGKPAPSKLPSVALAAARDTAQRRLDALRTLHGRAVERLAETYRTEAAAWSAAERKTADEAEQEAVAALAVLVEKFDAAKQTRAVADWTATTRTGNPQSYSGPDGWSGERLLVERVREALGIPGRELSAQWQREKRERAEREAAAERAYAEQQAERQRRQAEYEANEKRQAENLVKLLEAGGVPAPARTPEPPRGLSEADAGALDDLLAPDESEVELVGQVFHVGGDRA